MDLNSTELNIKIFQSALDISNIGVWNYNGKLKKVFFSSSSKAIIGFENDANFGNDIDDWNNRVHIEDKENYHKSYNDHIIGATNFYINKHRILCKDGTYKWILDQGHIINDPVKDGYHHFVGTHTDITSQVENEIKIENALTIATKQNNTLENFAHIVTHNLKLYSGNLESLFEFYDQAKNEMEQQNLIKQIKKVSSGLNKSIKNLNQIVSVQSKKETNIQKININDFIKDTAKQLDAVIVGKKAIINNEVDPKLFIYFNPAYFESVIQNLITNAIKYKHPNRDPIITVNSNITENNLIISIKDNGVGIDLEKYGKDIFGLYRTFHYNDNAEGVGLYLIKNQIEAFGGEITVESEVNVGTIFNIIIPNKKPNQLN